MTQPTEPRERPMHQAHVRGCVDQTHSFLSPCSVVTQPTGGTSGASLRDALATALETWVLRRSTFGREFAGNPADAILADPAFRAALTEAVAEAMASEDWSDSGWSALDHWDDLAGAIVARLLGAGA
jgi:hypothetical protein